MLPAELLAKNYQVCHFCKEGKLVAETEEIVSEFATQHLEHDLNLVTGQQFLSELLAQQYIDVDRPDLKPIRLTIGEKPAKSQIIITPMGMPGTREELMQMHKNLRREQQINTTTTTKLPQDRPLMVNTDTIEVKPEDLFIKYCAEWHKKIDTGIAWNQIKFDLRKIPGMEFIWLDQSISAYYICPTEFTNKEACRAIIKIAKLQRFGDESGEEWLVKQLVELLTK